MTPTHGVRVTHTRGDLAMIGQGLAATWIPAEQLLSLPPALSAEAKAVLDAADKRVTVDGLQCFQLREASTPSRPVSLFEKTELADAVMAYRASLAPPPPPKADVERFREALTEISNQRTLEEMTAREGAEADYEYAYDVIIEVARAALAPPPAHPPPPKPISPADVEELIKAAETRTRAQTEYENSRMWVKHFELSNDPLQLKGAENVMRNRAQAMLATEARWYAAVGRVRGGGE